MKKLVGVLFLTVCCMGFEYHLTPYTVTNGVSCFFGLYGDANQINGGRVVNTCYVESNKGYIVIDSGPTYQYAKQAYRAMQKVKKLPVQYIINTTVDELHILGNEFYKEKGARVIGPERYYELFNQELSLPKKISKKTFKDTRVVPIHSYIKEDRELSLGNIDIKIKRFDRNEGRHLVVYFPQKEIIFVGDYISNGETPTLDSCHSLAHWNQTLEEIEKLSWRYIISSHGTKRGRTAMLETKKYLNYLVQKEKKSKKNLKKNRKNSDITMYAKRDLNQTKMVIASSKNNNKASSI